MRKIVIATLLSLFFSLSAFGMKVFDMEEIRDPSTLQIKVLQDWHKVQGPIATRQKLVTINVGDLWPGQEYRVPVRMVVPANRKAKGFHLTGGSTPSRPRGGGGGCRRTYTSRILRTALPPLAMN